MKNFNRLSKLLALGLATVLCLTACGGKSEDSAAAAASGNTGSTAVNQSEYLDENHVYAASFKSLNLGNVGSANSSFYRVQLVGDCLYGELSSWDEETQESNSCLLGVNKETLEEVLRVNPSEDLMADPELGFAAKFPEKKTDDYYQYVSPTKFRVFEDNSIAILVNQYIYDQDKSTNYNYYVKYDSQGNLEKVIEVTNQLALTDENDYISDVLFLSDGSFVVAKNSGLMIFDQDCQATPLALEMSWMNRMFITGDDKVYAIYSDSNYQVQCTEILVKDKRVGESLSGIPADMNGIATIPNDNEHLLVYTSERVQMYNIKDGSTVLMFTWGSVDINGSYVDGVTVAEDGSILALVNDWNTNATELATISVKDKSEVAEKTELVVATLYDYELTEAVVAYNKSQDKYHVTLQTYYDWESGVEYEDAINNLRNALSGTTPPDLVDMSSLDMKALADGNLVEDLKTYLEKGSALNLSDYRQSLLDCYTFSDKLVGIPYSFQMQTMVVDGEKYGSMESGWTMQEMLKYANANPNSTLFNYSTKTNVLNNILSTNVEQFVDVSTGEVNFNGADFKTLLEYANTCPDEIADEDYSSYYSQILSGNVLTENVYLYQIQGMQEYEALFNNHANFIGYPSKDGTPRAYLTANTVLGLVSASNNKEGAWEFLQYFLSREIDPENSWEIPSNSKELQKLIDAQLAHAGEKTGGAVMYDDNFSYEYHYCTQEEIDRFLSILDSARPSGTMDNQIYQIVTEEVQPYFEGQKTVDEVCEIIQSRVSMYVMENM